MFKVAGVSKHQGAVKVRFANDTTRVKILAKNGHTDIFLMELPKEMEKTEVCKYLLTTDLMQTPEFAEAIEAADEKYNGAAVVKSATLKTGTTATAPKKTKSKPAPKKKAVPVDPAAKMAELKKRAETVAE